MSRKIVRDDVDRFLENRLYLPTRTIYVGSFFDDLEHGESGTDALMSAQVITSLHMLEQQDGLINILMNNPGGCVSNGLAIYDAIKCCRNEVKIIVYGQASSMGSIILQAADERVLAPNATVMVHYGEVSLVGHDKMIHKESDEIKRIDNLVENIYLEKIRVKHPAFKKRKIKDMLNFNTYLSAEQAVALGLADKILGESEE